MSITKDGFIRRVESTTRGEELIVMDIVDIDTEVKVSSTVFDYDAPPTATTIKDFLFSPGDE